jgi:hypothetical protein
MARTPFYSQVLFLCHSERSEESRIRLTSLLGEVYITVALRAFPADAR